MEASEPKWVNPIFNIIVVNSLRLGSLHISILIITEELKIVKVVWPDSFVTKYQWIIMNMNEGLFICAMYDNDSFKSHLLGSLWYYCYWTGIGPWNQLTLCHRVTWQTFSLSKSILYSINLRNVLKWYIYYH